MGRLKQRPYLLWPTVLFLWGMAVGLPILKAQHLGLDFHHLDRNKGLSQGSCPYVSRDSRGFVWISTTDGLNRFDGQNVRVYRPDPSKPNSMVGNILTSKCYEDPENGDMWFTTYNAIHRYIRAYDYFETIQLQSPEHVQLVADYYAFHFDTSGRLWLRVGLGKEGYLHIFDTKERRDSILCPLSGARSVAIPDKNGVVRQILCSEMSTAGFEVVDLTCDRAPMRYFQEQGRQYKVHEAFVENDTLVWLGLTGGIGTFNPQNGTSKVHIRSIQDSSVVFWSVHPYGKGLLFASTRAKGLWVFDRQLEQFTQMFVHEPDNPFSLLDNEAENLYVDPEENLWVGHWKYGLSYVNLRKNKFSKPASSKHYSFRQFFKGPDGNIWCSERNFGVLVFTPKGQFVDTLRNNLPGNKNRKGFHSRLCFPKGQHLGFYNDMLVGWNTRQRQLQFVRKLPMQISEHCITASGKTLVATNKGLFQVQDIKNTEVVFTPLRVQSPEPLLNIEMMYADSRGFVYISSNTNRLFVFQETAEGLVFRKIKDGIGSCKYFYELPAGQGIWIASTAGLSYIDPGLEIRTLTESADGLPNATYYGIAIDRLGRFWLNSNQGIVCYDTARHVTNRYKQVDGLFGNEFNTDAFYQALDGTVWAGGVGGMTVFHPDSVQSVPYIPQVQIIRIMANDEALDSTKHVEVLQYLDIPYSKNTLSFEFVGLEFSDPSANTYLYRLVGYDDRWVESGTHGFARYANLPPGNYTFEVLAFNADGFPPKTQKRTPKQLRIHIRTPFYMTWWFYSLCVAAVAALLYIWFRYRLEQALKIERMRVQISSDLHDDVGTLLSGLAMQSEVLELTANEKDKSKLRRIGEISRDAMARMRDTVWAIDARKDKLENLFDRMREHAEETLSPRGIQFQIEADQLNLKTNLPTQIRQNLYLIYKEAVTNAAKHSNGALVSVQVQKAGSGLEMRICDNGSTLEKNRPSSGSGMGNMKMRAEKMGGTLEVSYENGFCITLRLRSIG